MIEHGEVVRLLLLILLPGVLAYQKCCPQGQVVDSTRYSTADPLPGILSEVLPSGRSFWQYQVFYCWSFARGPIRGAVLWDKLLRVPGILLLILCQDPIRGAALWDKFLTVQGILLLILCQGSYHRYCTLGQVFDSTGYSTVDPFGKGPIRGAALRWKPLTVAGILRLILLPWVRDQLVFSDCVWRGSKKSSLHSCLWSICVFIAAKCFVVRHLIKKSALIENLLAKCRFVCIFCVFSFIHPMCKDIPRYASILLAAWSAEGPASKKM